MSDTTDDERAKPSQHLMRMQKFLDKSFTKALANTTKRYSTIAQSVVRDKTVQQALLLAQALRTITRAKWIDADEKFHSGQDILQFTSTRSTGALQGAIEEFQETIAEWIDDNVNNIISRRDFLNICGNHKRAPFGVLTDKVAQHSRVLGSEITTAGRAITSSTDPNEVLEHVKILEAAEDIATDCIQGGIVDYRNMLGVAFPAARADLPGLGRCPQEPPHRGPSA